MSRRRANGEGGAPVWVTATRRWKADYTGADGRRRCVYSSIPGPQGAAECRAKRDRGLDDVRAGVVPVPARLTVADWLDEWLRVWVADGSLSDRTVHNYRADIERHIVPAVGRRPLTKLGVTDVKELDLALAAKGLSGTTRQLVYDTLNRALKRAVINGLIAANPCERVDRPHRTTAEVDVWSIAEADQVIAATAGDRLEGLFAILLMLGLRKGEGLGLRWRDIEFEANSLTVAGQLNRFTGEHVPRKGHAKPLVHDMPDRVRELLWARRTEQKREQVAAGRRWAGNAEGYVFTTPRGEAIPATTFDRAWRALVARAGVRYLKPHGARHYAASTQYALGARDWEVAQFLGHADDSTVTRRYVHLGQAVNREATARVNRLYPGAQAGG